MRKEKRNQREKGITLIALIITIVVLLILAGIAIVTLTGKNGLVTQANKAKEETEKAEKEEKYNLAQQEDLINEYVTGITVEQVTDTNPGVLEGIGTEIDPYIINSIEDLVFFAYDVANGNTYEGKYVSLGLSLDFNSTKSYVDPSRTDYAQYGYEGELKTLLTTGTGFKIIDNEFNGNFNGQNQKIYNLYINIEDDTEQGEIGLFSINNGVIDNLELVNSNIKYVNKDYAITGSIAGSNYGIITNCSNSRKSTRG